MSQSLYIVVVGCGRLGGLLANHLSADGHELVVIDKNESQFDKLSTEFSGFKLEGDAGEISILRQANLQRADVLFAVTTEDNINLMVAQVAKQIFDVPRVVARVFDSARERVYGELGIETFSPTTLTAQAFINYIASEDRPR